MSSLRLAPGLTGQGEAAGTTRRFSGRASKVRASGEAVGRIGEPAGDDEAGAPAARPHPASRVTRTKAGASRVIITNTTRRGFEFPPPRSSGLSKGGDGDRDLLPATRRAGMDGDDRSPDQADRV